MARLFIGIDGGGSRCRARIRDEAGAECGWAEGGIANIYQDFDQTLATILDTARAAGAPLGAEPGDLHAGLGLAGATTPDAIDAVRQAQLPFADIAIDSDAYVACLGAHEGGDGGIVITGTGSAALALVAGERHAIGGWGFALGDDGSGAAIGRSAVRRAVLAFDGLIEPSSLLEALIERFGRDRSVFNRWAREARPRDYSLLAPLVFEAAASGDREGLTIVREAAHAVTLMARSLIRRGAPRLSLIGGLAEAITPYLDDDVATSLVVPRADPADGAIMMARHAAGLSGNTP